MTPCPSTRRGHRKLAIALILLGACARHANPPATGAVEATERPRQLFALHSSFWVNLHQRLYDETSLRGHASLQGGSASLGPDDRERWSAVLDFYRRRFPERDFGTPLPLVDLNRQLAQQGDGPTLTAAGLDPELAQHLESAAAVYRVHGWADDDRSNRAWIDQLGQALRQHGQAIAGELVSTYGARWPQAPIAVEVSVYAGPAGAYTDDDPALITITSGTASYQGEAALEMVFHEASHVLIGPVEAAIERACQARAQPVPEDLWHALLFYTTGEIVRRHLRGYVPFAYKNQLYGRGSQWDVYERALEAHWQPYLDGLIARDAAIRDVVAAVAGAPPS
jgi:hypothetical protein